MPLFRRSSAPAPQLLTDLAMGDAALAAARDRVVATNSWEPAADLLASTWAPAGPPSWDRRGAAVNAFAEAAVQPAPWLDDWLSVRPEDPGALAVAEWATVQRAWDARGGGRAAATGEDAFAAFFRILEDAVPACHAAARAGSADPTPWVTMIWLSIGRQDSREVLDDRWAELVARDPENRLGHIARLQCLCEKWYGSHAEMYEFARSVTSPSWAPVVVLQAHVEYVLQESDEGGGKHLRGFWQRPDIAADLERAHAWATGDRPSHAWALHDLSVVGYALSQAERWQQAAQVFAVAGHRAYEYPWYYAGGAERTYAAAHRKAMRAA
jgi:hypothetical protein